MDYSICSKCARCLRVLEIVPFALRPPQSMHLPACDAGAHHSGVAGCFVEKALLQLRVATRTRADIHLVEEDVRRSSILVDYQAGGVRRACAGWKWEYK